MNDIELKIPVNPFGNARDVACFISCYKFFACKRLDSRKRRQPSRFIDPILTIWCVDLSEVQHHLLWYQFLTTIPLPWACGNSLVIQWQPSVSGTWDPSVHWNATGERNVGSQWISSVTLWSSSGLPVVFYCVPVMQITTGLPLGHHWVLASASVVPVSSQCTCGSIGFPLCSTYANCHRIATERALGDSISQCGSSVVCPVVSQCTESICFGG